MLKIYNSYTKQKEIFKPIIANKASIYVCGPTAYDYIHIGNARSFTIFDMIVRFLKTINLDVTYVRNITDIDDKIINKSAKEGKKFSEVASFFTQAFKSDMKALNLLQPTYEPLATDNIAEIITLIEKLIANDKAYIAKSGDVYFQVTTFADYGCLAHRKLDEMLSGARVEISSDKRSPHDFVLWKMSKENEPAWDSPWGLGRPGWHIECSAMSINLLGESFDLHGGGKDLIFPHHENEIAQTEAVTGKRFVNYWLHAGYLQLAQDKMSKSLGNFVTLRDLLKSYLPEVIRFFLLSSHYRSPLQFSYSALTESHQALARLYGAIEQFSAVAHVKSDYSTKFMAAMYDDFNTPIAFAVLFDLAHEIQRIKKIDNEKAKILASELKYLAGILGLLKMDPAVIYQGVNSTDIDKVYVKTLIDARNTARAKKDWAEADRIRRLLQDDNIVLEDSSSGTRWRLKLPDEKN